MAPKEQSLKLRDEKEGKIESEPFKNIEEYKDSVEQLVKDIPQEERETWDIKEIAEDAKNNKEKLEVLDHNTARLFNYFGVKEQHRLRVANLKNTIHKRTEADFEQPLNWEGQNFSDVDFENLEIKNKANLRHIKIQGEKSNLQHTIFDNVDLSHATFYRIKKAAYIKFINLQLTQPQGGNIKVEECTMRGAVFSGKFDGLHIESSRLPYAEINANTKGLKITGRTEMPSSRMEGSFNKPEIDYDNVDLSGSTHNVEIIETSLAVKEKESAKLDAACKLRILDTDSSHRTI